MLIWRFGTGLLSASRMVAVMMESVEPPIGGRCGLASAVWVAAVGEPGSKDTRVGRVTPPAVELTVFSSARVDLRVTLNAPFASVDPLIAEKTCALPVEENVVARPGTGLPF